MKPKQNISPVQAAIFTNFGFIGLTNFIYLKNLAMTGRAAWVAALTGALIIMPLIWWLLHLANLYPGNTILEIIELTTGKLVGKVLNSILILIAVSLAACNLIYFTYIMQTFILPHTPTPVIILIVNLISLLMAVSGIEVMARMGFILYLVIMMLYLPIAFVAISSSKIENITPIFDISWWQFMKGVFFHAGASIEGLLLLMMMTTALPKPKKYVKAISINYINQAMFACFTILLPIAVLGVEQASRMNTPLWVVFRTFQIGTFLYGLEIIVIITAQILCYFKVAVYLYISGTAIQQTFNKRSLGVLWWVLFMAITGTTIWINSFNRMYAVAIFLTEYVMWPFVLLVLAVASVGSYVKSRSKC